MGARVLVVDDDRLHGQLMSRWLDHEGHVVSAVPSGSDALAALAVFRPDAILLDVHMAGMGGTETLRHIRAREPMVPVLMLTADGDVERVVEAMHAGAWDYLVKPVTRTKVSASVRNAVAQRELQLQVRSLTREAQPEAAYCGLLGESPPMRVLYRHLDRVGPSDATVLISGESGTGKELVARALHAASARSKGPFVAINCAAIPEGVQDSELFGHERGAFTGAVERRPGRFEQADGGTLFLDEVGDLSPATQARLLRALQERTFFRVGGQEEVRVDVRVVAATHRDLWEETLRSQFRKDLYFRLAVYEIDMPALRDRGRDVQLLADHYLDRFARQFGRGDLTLTEDARAALQAHSWPGNVRELQNALERATLSAQGPWVGVSHLPQRIGNGGVSPSRPPAAVSRPPEAAPGTTVAATEEALIRQTLAEVDDNVTEACARLGLSRSTLYRRLRRMGLR